ncbi:MAG TPA: NUDIX hydrolase [Candidatus Saccharimonadales bacterium]|nr:NUDIX hydrolase [Candidatus Saccharimonadales bacterium]
MTQLKKWKEIKRQIVFKKYSWTIEQRDYEMLDGEIVDWYIATDKSGVCVFALTDDNKVVTARMYRPGPNAIFRELPGGKIENGQDLKSAGMHELLEETGFTGEVQWIGKWYEDARVDRTRYVIVATNCKKIGDQQLDVHDEFIEIELVDIPEFVKQVRRGELTDTAGAMLALDHLGLLN